MRKFITYFLLSALGLTFILVVTLACIIFFKPMLIVTPRNINYVLEKTQVLQAWKWEEAEINHQWVKWNERIISGYFHGFCFSYQNDKASIETCLQEMSWNFIISYTHENGFKATAIDPFKVVSNLINIEIPNIPPSKKETTEPPDVWNYWNKLWSEIVPDVYIKFDKIVLKQTDSIKTFDFSLTKNQSQLEVKALDFSLFATPKRFELTTPKAYQLPGDHPTQRPLHLREFKLSGLVKERAIPLEMTGILEVAPFTIDSVIDLPLKDDLTSASFIKKVLLKTRAEIEITEIKKNLKSLGPPPFNELPAPLNAMEGSIFVKVTTEDTSDPNMVVINATTDIDFESNNQAFKLGLLIGTPFNLEDYSPGEITLQIDFRKVALQLPRVSKKRAPPQFYPDPRFKNTAQNPVEKKSPKEESESDLSLHLTAVGKKSLHIKTDLLDEALRVNFDLLIEKGNLKKGFIDILPLKTTVFKRRIEVPSARVTFQHPLEPVVDADVHFLLPEYKIILTLEGPLSKPRHYLSSIPPLPQNDIYAVLLFGRPLADLDPDSQSAASRTNQMLAQGILSLSVLYFLSGSPVEYVGYDPNSGQASAQIGLGRKTSLRVGAGQEGSKSTGIRRSLGKGWYIDNSVQYNPSGNSKTRDYGVMLERIIAY